MTPDKGTRDSKTNKHLNQNTLIVISLERIDLGQIIEGLSLRQEEWQHTADWHKGKPLTSQQEIKESSNAEEAQWIANNYARILSIIKRQMDNQIQSNSEC